MLLASRGCRRDYICRNCQVTPNQFVWALKNEKRKKPLVHCISEINKNSKYQMAFIFILFFKSSKVRHKANSVYYN